MSQAKQDQPSNDVSQPPPLPPPTWGQIFAITPPPQIIDNYIASQARLVITDVGILAQAHGS